MRPANVQSAHGFIYIESALRRCELYDSRQAAESAEHRPAPSAGNRTKRLVAADSTAGGDVGGALTTENFPAASWLLPTGCFLMQVARTTVESEGVRVRECYGIVECTQRLSRRVALT